MSRFCFYQYSGGVGVGDWLAASWQVSCHSAAPRNADGGQESSGKGEMCQLTSVLSMMYIHETSVSFRNSSSIHIERGVLRGAETKKHR